MQKRAENNNLFLKWKLRWLNTLIFWDIDLNRFTLTSIWESILSYNNYRKWEINETKYLNFVEMEGKFKILYICFNSFIKYLFQITNRGYFIYINQFLNSLSHGFSLLIMTDPICIDGAFVILNSDCCSGITDSDRSLCWRFFMQA